jgi:hypothetical protein
MSKSNLFANLADLAKANTQRFAEKSAPPSKPVAKEGTTTKKKTTRNKKQTQEQRPRTHLLLEDDTENYKNKPYNEEWQGSIHLALLCSYTYIPWIYDSKLSFKRYFEKMLEIHESTLEDGYKEQLEEEFKKFCKQFQIDPDKNNRTYFSITSQAQWTYFMSGKNARRDL